MDIGPITPTRFQLSQFLGNNPQLIISMEQLFQKAGTLTPEEINAITILIEEASINAQTAMATAVSAQASLESIALSLAILASSPPEIQIVASDDLTPTTLAQVANDDLSPVIPLGTLGVQQADDVVITGGSVIANLTNNQTILLASSATLTNGSGALTATLTNSPILGNPTKWIAIDDNGTPRYIPTWG